MPQLGESVAEGTIGKWLKKPGDHVAKYEPLVEVITDKVNAEVPSPFEGVLKEILVEEGATVPNNAEIAIIETADEAGGTEAAGTGTAPAEAAKPAAAAQPQPSPTEAPAPAGAGEARADGGGHGPAGSDERPAREVPETPAREEHEAPAREEAQRPAAEAGRAAAERSRPLPKLR